MKPAVKNVKVTGTKLTRRKKLAIGLSMFKEVECVF